MKLAHNIGYVENSNYTTPAKLLACTERIGFDGIYRNVYLYKDLLLQLQKPPILFVMGSYVGKDNSFDHPQPLEEYCTWDQIMDLAINYRCELGWHTWTHPKLTELGDFDLLNECKPPFPMKYFAYPYGSVDQRVATVVKNLGYQEAWSVSQGDDTQFQRRRTYI